MVSLIACLGTGKGTWLTVQALLKNGWDNIFMVTSAFGMEKFRAEVPIRFIVVDPDADVSEIKSQILRQLEIDDFEIAVNIDSGSGKEHMALISSLMQKGVSLRFVTIEKQQLKEITPNDN